MIFALLNSLISIGMRDPTMGFGEKDHLFSGSWEVVEKFKGSWRASTNVGCCRGKIKREMGRKVICFLQSREES